MILVPREAQNLSQSMFSCMLIPFSMFLLDSDEGKVKYSPLYGRESKVTILVGRHFQSGMLPFERAFKKTWLGHIFVRNWRPNQKCTFLAGLPYPPQKTFYDSGPTRGTKPIPKYVFLHADSIFNVFTWLWRGQSQILTPIWTGKQSDDFGRSPFSIRDVAVRKSVQKNLIGTHFC